MTDFSKAKYSLLALYTHEPEDFAEELHELAHAIVTKTPYDSYPTLTSWQLTELLQQISDSCDVNKLTLINEINEKQLRSQIKKYLLGSGL